MQQPYEYERRILVAVSGMSPQIVTETLYALAHQQPAFIPTEIHLISTSGGAERAFLQLLHPKDGKFHHFCRDYALPAIQFNADSIHIIVDADGVTLDDIKTPAQNEAAADYITAKVQHLTADDNAALHVSIAGGRKTMGYYLGYALSLYGRPQDRLSHVLVTELYEGLPNFFYPTLESHVIHTRNNQPLDTQKAEVMLAEIPFVRMRRGIPEALLNGQVGFNDSVQFAQRFERTTQLKIDVKHKQLWANEVAVKLSGVNFAFYVWMLEQTVKQKRSIQRRTQERENAVSFLSFYESLFDGSEIEKTQKLFQEEGMTEKWLSERINAVKKAFEKAVGQNASKVFLITKTGTNNYLQYSVNLKAQQLDYL